MLIGLLDLDLMTIGYFYSPLAIYIHQDKELFDAKA